MDGVTFYHKITKSSNDWNNDDWQKSTTFHECAKKGHIRSNRPDTKINKDDDKESTDKEKRKYAKINLNKVKME